MVNLGNGRAVKELQVQAEQEKKHFQPLLSVNLTAFEIKRQAICVLRGIADV